MLVEENIKLEKDLENTYLALLFAIGLAVFLAFSIWYLHIFGSSPCQRNALEDWALVNQCRPTGEANARGAVWLCPNGDRHLKIRHIDFENTFD